MKILGVIFCLVNNHRWHEALAVSSVAYQTSKPEGGYISCLGFPNTFTREELVGTDNSEPLSIGIKADLVTIPNLGWTRLDFFEVFGYYFQVKRHCRLLH